MHNLIAVYLPADHPICLNWARDNYRRPAARWAIRQSSKSGMGSLAGWELETFTTWSQARSAIIWLEHHGGSPSDWRESPGTA
jgi:hypothetical protein